MVSAEFPPALGGVGRYVWCLSHQLAERGWKVSILTRTHPDVPKRSVCDGIEIVRIPFKITDLVLNSRRTRTLSTRLEALGSDVVHVHSPYPEPVTSDVPLAVTFHVVLRDVLVRSRSNLVRQIGYRVFRERLLSNEQSLLLHSNAISCVSRTTADLVSEMYSIPRDRVSVVENGYDETIFGYGKWEDRDQDLILYTGRLDLNKGLVDLLLAFKSISETNPSTRLVITGTGYDERVILAEARKLRVGRKVQFLGRVSDGDLANLYRKASLFVSPTYIEGLSTTIIEAMASGTPVLVSDIPNNRELIESGRNGMTFPVGKVEDLSLSLRLMLDDERLRRRMSETAAEEARLRYSWKKIASNHEALYHRLVG
jgi:glycosyltransferase involved in cell wall biosynthesis